MIISLSKSQDIEVEEAYSSKIYRFELTRQIKVTAPCSSPCFKRRRWKFSPSHESTVLTLAKENGKKATIQASSVVSDQRVRFARVGDSIVKDLCVYGASVFSMSKGKNERFPCFEMSFIQL